MCVCEATGAHKTHSKLVQGHGVIAHQSITHSALRTLNHALHIMEHLYRIRMTLLHNNTNELLYETEAGVMTNVVL